MTRFYFCRPPSNKRRKVDRIPFCSSVGSQRPIGPPPGGIVIPKVVENAKNESRKEEDFTHMNIHNLYESKFPFS